MKIFNYHPVTGQYIGESAADPSPAEPGEFLLPAFSTEIEPPVPGNNQTAVCRTPTGRIPADYRDGSWEIIPDYRGTIWWRPDGTQYRISDLGIEPATEDSNTEPLPTFSQVKAMKLAALASYRYQRETAGITVAGTTIKTDRESQSMLAGAKIYSDMNEGILVDWKAENGWVQIDRTVILAMSQAVAAHIQACFSREKIHGEAIEALITVEDIDTYNFTTGWPV